MTLFLQPGRHARSSRAERRTFSDLRNINLDVII